MKKEKSEQWWRWLLFVPAGVVTFLVGVVIGTILNYLENRWIDSWFWTDITQIIVGVISLYFSVGVASMVAPKEKIGAIIYSSIMLIVYCAILVLSIIGAYMLPNVTKDWMGYVTVVLYMITLIASMVAASNGKFENNELI